jgi:hypothetical protein
MFPRFCCARAARRILEPQRGSHILGQGCAMRSERYPVWGIKITPTPKGLHKGTLQVQLCNPVGVV